MAPRTIVVGNTKGGVGKTTTAVELAVHLHRPDGRVLLIDADPGRTALSWASRARAAGTWPRGLETYAHPFPNVHRAVARLSAGFELTVVDTPHDPSEEIGPALASAITAADLFIAPTGANLAELDRLPELVKYLEDERHRRPAFRWALLITRFDLRRSPILRVLEKAVASRSWPIFPVPVPHRAAVADAFGSGTPLLHYAPTAEHVRRLLSPIPA